MGTTKGLIALLVAGGFMFAGHAKAVDISVSTLKMIAIDKESAAGKSKLVYVTKDAGVAKSDDNDVDGISVTLDVTYAGTLGTATAKFEIPAGASNGTEGWLVNKETVAKFVNKATPAGSTVAKVVVVKPTKVLKLVSPKRGDLPDGVGSAKGLNLIAAGAPVGSVFTAATVTEASETNRHCSEFQAGSCVYKEIAGGSGRKLVCKVSAGDPTCAAGEPPCAGAGVLEFRTGAAGGTCGEARMGGSGGTILKALTCGGLNIGGGDSTVPEGPTPANAPTQFNASCAAGSCTISARTSGETGSLNNCSAAGCNFGTFLSISNGGLSTCVHNTFSVGGSGTASCGGGTFTGSVPLTSEVTVTGNDASPCPKCSGAPGAGTCPVTAVNSGAACVGVNASGDNYECIPSGSVLTPFGVDLSPIGTGTSTKVGPTFCPGQSPVAPGKNGCFAFDDCDYIEERGAHGTGLDFGAGAKAARLASVFCIPATGNGLIDGAADLPGPGATSLPGTLELF